MANGIPVLQRLANPAGSPARLTSLCACPSDSGRTRLDKTRNSLIQFSGNGLNINVAGALELYALLWSEIDYPSPVMGATRALMQGIPGPKRPKFKRGLDNDGDGDCKRAKKKKTKKTLPESAAKTTTKTKTVIKHKQTVVTTSGDVESESDSSSSSD